MRTGFLLTAKFHGLLRGISFHLIQEVAERKLEDLIEARNSVNESEDFLEILEELDPEIVSWYNVITDFSEVGYEMEEISYE